MQRHLFSNADLKAALEKLPFNVMVNNLLLKDYISSVSDIEKMAKFRSDLGVTELKVRELVGRSAAIHDFIETDSAILGVEKTVSSIFLH